MGSRMTLLAITQFNSQDNIDKNLFDVEYLIQQAKLQAAELIVLPENFACFAAGKQRETAAQFDDLKQRVEHLAFKYQIWIVAGTLPCPYRPNGSIIQDLSLIHI